MLSPLLAVLLLGAAMPPEPDGSRALGFVPPYRAEPAAPDWLRAVSHARAKVASRHYVYEAYAGAGGRWMVRYVPFPDGKEPDPVRCFLFTGDPGKEPEILKAEDVAVSPREARWKGLAYVLVDKRDLLRP